jgi:hypothetical protein
MPPVHASVPQAVAAEGNTQPLRSVPLQVAAQLEPSPVQAARVPRGAPLTALQAPTKPGTLQASHWPMQGTSQHTVSAHAPDTHSLAVAQVAPLVFLVTQMLPLHQASSEHSESLVHAVSHAPETQRL